MDAWIVVLRGDEDALVEARAVLGAPIGSFDPIAVFTFDTADPMTAAGSIVDLVERVRGIAGGVSLAGDEPAALVRERALALALSAPEGEILFDAPARARIDSELVFVAPRARAGWRLPVRASAVAPEWALRERCRDQIQHLPDVPLLIARDRQVAALAVVLKDPGWCIVHAAPGDGGARVIDEAAQRAGVVLTRLTQRSIRDADALTATLESVGTCDGVIVDPVGPEGAATARAIFDRLGATHRIVVRVHDPAVLGTTPPGRVVEIPPLRAYDAIRLLRAMLGGASADGTLRRLARPCNGHPAHLVEAARAALQLGLLVPDGQGSYRLRERAALRRRNLPVEPAASRIHDLPAHQARMLSVVVALGLESRVVDVLAALRGGLACEPDDALRMLRLRRFLVVDGARARVCESTAMHTTSAVERVTAIDRAGALDVGARAEEERRRGTPEKAAEIYASAARFALQAGHLAAAARFASAAQTQGGAISSHVREMTAKIAQKLIPGMVLRELEGSRPALARGKTLDPTALEHAATGYDERAQPETASRMRALAELLRGNGDKAVSLGGGGSHHGSSRTHLVTALGQGSKGHLADAVRSTLLALAAARRSHDGSGEAAALALMGTLYRTLGRTEEARALSEHAHHVPVATG